MNSAQHFNTILQTFGIGATCVAFQQVDNYFYYDIQLRPFTRVKQLERYGDEISLALKTPCRPRIRILHDQGVVRMEFISPRQQPLMLLDLFTNNKIPTGDAVCLLGQTVDGQQMWMDLAKNPHLIIAGTTGSGKSTLLHNIIANLYNYNNCLLHLVDPKRIEFYLYEQHFPRTCKVHYSYEETLVMLDEMLNLMEERYVQMRHGTPASQLQYIVVIIDEFADLMMQDEQQLFYAKLCRLAQKSRAARMSLILATQRPSVNIISGDIKANFPARIACRVASHVDSKVILDATGAQNLLGCGDALVRDNSRFLERFQVAYTTASEVCQYLGE